MIRQTDNIRVTKRCKEPEYYYHVPEKKFKVPHCIYLSNGKCELNACIKVIENDNRV